jgi:hypothetical protein
MVIPHDAVEAAVPILIWTAEVRENMLTRFHHERLS